MRTITSLTPLAHCLTSFATARSRMASAMILATVLLAAVPALFNTASLSAQGFACMECWDNKHDRYYFHWTLGNWPWFENGYGPGDGEHTIPRLGHCDAIHGMCVYVAQTAESLSTTRELTQAISDAVVAEDVASLAEYAVGPLVNLHADRSAIQILGCDRKIVAGHIPLSRNLLAAIEIAVAELLEPDA